MIDDVLLLEIALDRLSLIDTSPTETELQGMTTTMQEILEIAMTDDALLPLHL